MDHDVISGARAFCVDVFTTGAVDVFLDEQSLFGNGSRSIADCVVDRLFEDLYSADSMRLVNKSVTGDHGVDLERVDLELLDQNTKTTFATNVRDNLSGATQSHSSRGTVPVTVPFGAITSRSAPLWQSQSYPPSHIVCSDASFVQQSSSVISASSSAVICTDNPCLCQHLCPHSQPIVALGCNLPLTWPSCHPDAVLSALSVHTNKTTATVDSGANKLFCPARTDFISYKAMQAHVTLAAGTPQLLIQGCGWVRKIVVADSGRSHTLTLPAYHAPSFHTDLVGVDPLNSAGIGCVLTPSALYLALPDGDRVPITRSPRALFEFQWTTPPLPTAAVVACKIEISADIAHQRCGHTSDPIALCLRRHNLATGVPALTGAARPFCIACALAKSTACNVPRTPSRNDDAHLFGTVFIDFKTMDCIGIGGYKYLLGFACRHQQTKLWVFPTSARTIMHSVHLFETMVHQYSPNMGVSCYRTDGALELVCSTFRQHCAKQNIRLETTPPYMPQLNSNIEVCWRFLTQMVRAMHVHANLPKQMWPLTANAAAFVKRLLPSSRNAITPHEIVTGKKPDHTHLRVFGCDAYTHRPREVRTTLDHTARLTCFAGYHEPFSFTHPTWLVYDPATKRTMLSDSVVCNETAFSCATSMPGARTGKESQPLSTADISLPAPLSLPLSGPDVPVALPLDVASALPVTPPPPPQLWGVCQSHTCRSSPPLLSCPSPRHLCNCLLSTLHLLLCPRANPAVFSSCPPSCTALVTTHAKSTLPTRTLFLASTLTCMGCLLMNCSTCPSPALAN